MTEGEFEHMKSNMPEFQLPRFNRERPGSLFAWNLLALSLKKCWNIDRLPACVKPQSGKPFFAQHRDMEFSLSHNDRYALCAVSNDPVGCDIEWASRRPSGLLVNKVLTDNERIIYGGSHEPDRLFMKLWTLKEAKLKKDGTGLAGGVGQTDMADVMLLTRAARATGEHFTVFDLDGNYVSVCGSQFAHDIIVINQ